MGEPIKVICSCGKTYEPDISLDYNLKDIVYCDDCKRTFLIVEITE